MGGTITFYMCRSRLLDIKVTLIMLRYHENVMGYYIKGNKTISFPKSVKCTTQGITIQNISYRDVILIL